MSVFYTVGYRSCCHSLFVVLLIDISHIIAHQNNLDDPFNEHHQKSPDLRSDLRFTKSGRNFTVYWNVPTERCAWEFGTRINVSTYGIITNSKDGWTGKKITIFPHPGLYPSVAANGSVINGGIPQNVDLASHLSLMKRVVSDSIPWPGFSGLGVVDYEAWLPNWNRNWAGKAIYKNMSRDLVREKHPQWSREQIEQEAIKEFEHSARLFLDQTMSLCTLLRPRGQWGYYLYPDCYNYAGEVTCSNKTKQLNDRILWLFEAGSALFPSGYLSSSMDQTKNRNLVRGMVEEALRIQRVLRQTTGSHKPVYLYSRFRYKNRDYYCEEDLWNSIGQAHALGADGVILWDDHDLSISKSMCQSVKNYVDGILGPFVYKLIQSSSL